MTLKPGYILVDKPYLVIDYYHLMNQTPDFAAEYTLIKVDEWFENIEIDMYANYIIIININSMYHDQYVYILNSEFPEEFLINMTDYYNNLKNAFKDPKNPLYGMYIQDNSKYPIHIDLQLHRCVEYPQN